MPKNMATVLERCRYIHLALTAKRNTQRQKQMQPRNYLMPQLKK